MYTCDVLASDGFDERPLGRERAERVQVAIGRAMQLLGRTLERGDGGYSAAWLEVDGPGVWRVIKIDLPIEDPNT